MDRGTIAVDGCAACAHVVHATSEIVTICPITPVHADRAVTTSCEVVMSWANIRRG